MSVITAKPLTAVPLTARPLTAYALGVSTSGAAFSPLDLFASGEQGGWWDASDFSTMFQDSAGTTPVTAVEQPVGLHRDKSGRGNHRFQATTTKRPVLKIDGNGKYYLKYDGVDDFLATAAVNFTATDKMTTWHGAQKQDATARMLAELSSAVNGNFGAFFVLAGVDTGADGWNTLSRGTSGLSGTQGSVVVAAGVSKDVVTTTHTIPGDNTTIYKNGVAGTPGTGDKGTGNFGSYPLYFGARAGTSLFFNGHEYQTVILGRAATTNEIANTIVYVNDKTGAY